jgi:hypothetical protein
MEYRSRVRISFVSSSALETDGLYSGSLNHIVQIQYGIRRRKTNYASIDKYCTRKKRIEAGAGMCHFSSPVSEPHQEEKNFYGGNCQNNLEATRLKKFLPPLTV